MKLSSTLSILAAAPMTWAVNATTSFIIPNSRDSSLNSTQGTGTFTGVAWIDVAHSDNSTWIGNVIFMPTAHTFWHRHEGGQLLKVTAGSGWVADRDGEARRVHAGDTAWCPPGIVHWHGADAGSYMIHYAAAFGATEWMEEVSDEDYAKAVAQL